MRRGISQEEVLRVLKTVDPFPYNQHGVEHLGYYDPDVRLFVAVVEDLVVTVFHTRPTYVEGLRRRNT